MFFKNLIYFMYPKECILCMKKISENDEKRIWCFHSEIYQNSQSK